MAPTFVESGHTRAGGGGGWPETRNVLIALVSALVSGHMVHGAVPLLRPAYITGQGCHLGGCGLGAAVLRATPLGGIADAGSVDGRSDPDILRLQHRMRRTAGAGIVQ